MYICLLFQRSAIFNSSYACYMFWCSRTESGKATEYKASLASQLSRPIDVGGNLSGTANGHSSSTLADWGHIHQLHYYISHARERYSRHLTQQPFPIIIISSKFPIYWYQDHTCKTRALRAHTLHALHSQRISHPYYRATWTYRYAVDDLYLHV